MNLRAFSLSFAVVFAAACATDDRSEQTPDADLGGGGMDSGGTGDGAASMLPAWMLEDVQPQSPRSGQTYGLSAFTDHTVVVVLLEGH